MEIIDAIKDKFKVWLLIQRDKYLRKEIAKIPSDNSDDYFFDNLTNQFVYKDSSLNIQIGWQNTLNVLKTQIEAVNIHTENLEAIINDIAQVNIDTTALTAIIANIASIDVDIGNLQTIITDIANIETLNTTISGNIASLTAIIDNIGTMNINIANLQSIIADIANIETLNTTISGNITSLTAIIANIGTMNTNIDNLQAIISDIANIETQNISMSTALATINTNIGTINTAITNINAINADIEVNIEAVKDLDIEIVNQTNKGISTVDNIDDGQNKSYQFISDDYLFNRMSILAYNIGGTGLGSVNINIYGKIVSTYMRLRDDIDIDMIGGKIEGTVLPFTAFPHIKVEIYNNSGYEIKFEFVVFFSKNLKPELDEHVETSNIHFLENPIGSIIMFSGVWTDNITKVGWYKCDGNNGTVNLVNKFVRGGATSGNTGGSDNAIVVSHTHKLKKGTLAFSGVNRNVIDIAGVSTSGYVDFAGVSGVNKNIPVYYTLIFIQRIN